MSGKPMPDAPPLKLFDEIERTETRPKSYREPIYSYYNSSSRRPIAAVPCRRGSIQRLGPGEGARPSNR